MSNKQQNIVSQWIRENIMSSKAAGHVVMMAVLVAVLGVGVGIKATSASAHGVCASSDTAYTVSLGDTLSAISQRTNNSVQRLASYNKISNPDFILLGQTLCIPGQTASTAPTVAQPAVQSIAHYNVQSSAAVGSYNGFPYGQCTYWADERYHQLHGVYVPWVVNSNAWQWVDRAYQYHWRVSSTPSVGSIMVLAPGVQGSWGYGHVAIVESVQGNTVTTSNMNWNGSGSSVIYWRFTAGTGVSFITNY